MSDLVLGRDIESIRTKMIEHFFSSLREKTKEAYKNDLKSFSQFVGKESLEQVAQYFISLSHGEANLLSIEWRTNLLESGLAASSINRRLAALRSLVSFARMLGLISWKLEVKNLKTKSYKNVRGPGQSAYERMLSWLDSQSTRHAKRDKAILVMFHDLGLRRAELSNINLEDLTLEESSYVAVSGKGRDEKELLSIPHKTFNVLNEWIRIRGSQPGPLFTSFDRAKKGSGRLSPNAIYERIKAIGKAVGVKTHPHAIRHLAITEACKLAQANGFGLEELLDFSRHSNVSTLMIYRDKERDIQGEISKLLSVHNSKTKKLK